MKTEEDTKGRGKFFLHLKRKYSKDEDFALLIQRLKATEYENGVLKSDIAELQYQIKEYKNGLGQVVEHKELKKRYNKLKRKHKDVNEELVIEKLKNI